MIGCDNILPICQGMNVRFLNFTSVRLVNVENY